MPDRRNDDIDIPVNFKDLPRPTKLFLAQLRPEDIRQLSEAIKLANAFKTVGIFVKWLVIAVVGTFVGAVSLGESISKVLGWLGKGSVK